MIDTEELYMKLKFLLFTLLIVTCSLFISCSNPSGPGGGDPNEGMDGTAAKPYKVYNVATLQKAGRDTGTGWTLDAHYEQTANITLTANPAGNWTPIGDNTNRFTGTYDGGGKIISNLTINASTADWQGMFGYVDSGTVKNIGLVSLNVSGRNNVGGVAGTIYSGTVSNCFVSGSVSGSTNIGGVAGTNDGEGMVSNCYVMGAVSGSSNNIGGVVGNNYYRVLNCYAAGSVIGNNNVGGVAGYNLGGMISICYATGSVLGSDMIGGVVGNNASYSTIQNCIALNSSVIRIASANGIGRVAGRDGGGTLTTNYGRDGMMVKTGTADKTIVNSAGGVDGANITVIQWNNAAWWSGMAGFSSPSWEFRNGLPTLKDMPAGTQNPVTYGGSCANRLACHYA